MSKEIEQDMSWLVRTIDAIVTRQRPLVVRYLREQRRKHPHLSPEQMVHRLERQFLAAVSTSGAAVGATAVAPGIGTVSALGLTVAETVAFLEASAFFTQAVTEVHGLHLRDPERAKALVMSLMLGNEGSALVRRVAEQSIGRGVATNAFWGQLITTNLPSGFIANTVVDYLKRAFLRRMTTQAGTSAIGRAIPFGIGAVVGGVGNHVLGRAIVKNAREAFGPAPLGFTIDLDPQPKAQRPKRIRERRSLKQRLSEGIRRSTREPGITGGEIEWLGDGPAPTLGGAQPPASPPAEGHDDAEGPAQDGEPRA